MLSRQVWILSLIALCNDAASELLVPILPLYLSSIGYGFTAIGLIEGVAEALSGISKAYFGSLSDKLGKRAIFVQLGYALSAVSKPLIGLTTSTVAILGLRITDRLGKGVRTAARDALLSTEASSESKARVFGFHRSMDTLGAVIGPLLALAYLHFYPKDYARVFLIAIIPSAFAVLLATWLRDNAAAIKLKASKVKLANYWQKSTLTYKKLVLALLVFSIANSSDTFLLLKLKQLQFTDAQVILSYVFFNVCYAAAAYPLGILADKIGLKKIIVLGLLLFALTYLCFGLLTNKIMLLISLALYGVYNAATEGVSKALISKTCSADNLGKALGFYTAGQSICLLLASIIAGLLWQNNMAHVSFIISGSLALLVALALWRMRGIEAS